jgi:hypothetical protein
MPVFHWAIGGNDHDFYLLFGLWIKGRNPDLRFGSFFTGIVFVQCIRKSGKTE